jgi:uncharacterized protein (DUF1501 family)
MSLSRRRFLQGTGLAALAAPLAASADDKPALKGPEAKSADAQKPAAPPATEKPAPKPLPQERALVLIQLAGGNDGLNTVVPAADPLYRKLRPQVGLAPSELLDLDGKVALHEALRPLHERFKAGKVAIVQGVGYPQPNRSHFESTAIWQAARLQPHLEAEGWLGRALEPQPRQKGKEPAHALPQPGPFALTAVGGGALTPTFFARQLHGTVLSSLEAFAAQPDRRFPGDAPALFKALGALYAPQALPVEQVGSLALQSSERLKAAVTGYQSMVQYPRTGFGDQLRLCAQLLCSGLGVRGLHVTLGGFDTHGNQKPQQRGLLQQLAEGMAALLDDCAGHGLADKVAVMTYSEFGRRAAENASAGTDHGAASVLFLAGAGVKGGLYGQAPDLSKLVDGDVPHSVDFRAVYASVLRDWFGLPPEPELTRAIAQLPLFA